MRGSLRGDILGWMCVVACFLFALPVAARRVEALPASAAVASAGGVGSRKRKRRVVEDSDDDLSM